MLPFHKTSEHVQYTVHSWTSHNLPDKGWRRQTVFSAVLSSERASWWDCLIPHKEILFAFCPLLQISGVCIIRPLALPMPSPALIQSWWGLLECPPWACAREANAEPCSTSFWAKGGEFLPETGNPQDWGSENEDLNGSSVSLLPQNLSYTHVQEGTWSHEYCIPMCMPAWFTVAPKYKQSKCPSAD